MIDISVPITGGMVVYPGDEEVRLERVASIADGEDANISRLSCGVHTGTHVDAPLHFFDGDIGVDGLSLDALTGPAHVVDATFVDRELAADSLRRIDLPSDTERLLFKTRNSQLWEKREFSDDFVRFNADGARALAELGVRLVGIDYLSVGDPDTHRVLLGSGLVVLEGIDLREVEPGPYQLLCLPLRLVGSEGAPCRAVLARP